MRSYGVFIGRNRFHSDCHSYGNIALKYNKTNALLKILDYFKLIKIMFRWYQYFPGIQNLVFN